MSEPKLISPMLDNFAMGDPMSSHDGVRCCPAMANDSDEKYIVKIISIPASQVQLDALLLAGAYPDSASALDYFKELSNGVIRETQTLQKLSKLEGFVPYERWQVVPMENEVGYDIYLLSPYRRSLQRFFRKNTMTHLGAVNLGLDLCAAMAVCRHTGVLYVDLKPGNIFISEDQEYRVGDLGFVPLNSLKFASLPEKYRSAYTPPEIQDASSTLNTTMDIYAIGLILYQAFNGGVLPFTDRAPEEPLPPPQYADYEMAEIILKACAPDPKDRWEDPTQMGQAIVSYMQRNGANDTPIVPPPAQVAPATPSASEPAPDTAEEPSVPETVPEEPETVSEPDSSAKTPPAEEDALSFLEDMVSDETAPDADAAYDVAYQELSDETSDILSQADALIAHETPEPVVAPEPIDVPMPPPIVLEPEQTETEEPPEQEAAAPSDDSGSPAEASDPVQPEEPQPEEAPAPNPPKTGAVKRAAAVVLVLALVAGLIFGAHFFYENYYLLPIESLQLNGTENTLTVQVTSQIDESMLTVICKDTHGNAILATLTNGIAQFTDLNPNTQYQVSLEVSGFHRLTGQTSGSYNTPAQTSIVQFNAITGPEDGSVILSFTVDGKEPDQWSILYQAEGELEQSITFAGHMVTVHDLTVGKEYTFRLVSASPLYLVGTDQITYTASALVYAQDLTIVSFKDNAIILRWSAPEGQTVEEWTVRCYSEDGYDQTITTTETEAEFTGIDTTKGHTVEVTAKGMTAGSHTYVTDNAVTVSNIQTDTSNSGQISLSWDCTGAIPENGWLLLYTIDGSEHQEVVSCEENSAVVSPMVPGAHYEFTIQAASGVTVLDGAFSADTPEAEEFNGYNLRPSEMEFSMCLTPDKADWTYSDLSEEDLTTTFQVGQKASFSVRTTDPDYRVDMNNLVAMFVIRDENGNYYSVSTYTEPWGSLWHSMRCELDIPALPDTPGSYTIAVYFNGAFVYEQAFTVTAAQ